MIVVERREDWASYLPSEEVPHRPGIPRAIGARPRRPPRAGDQPVPRLQVPRPRLLLFVAGRGPWPPVIPSLRCISELARKSVYGLAPGWPRQGPWTRRCAVRPMAPPTASPSTLYFGHTEFEPLADLARQLFEAFPSDPAGGVPSPAGLAYRGRAPWRAGTACAATRRMSSPMPSTVSAGAPGACRVRGGWHATTWRSCTIPTKRCRRPTRRRWPTSYGSAPASASTSNRSDARTTRAWPSSTPC